MEPVQQDSLDSTAACTSLCKQLRLNGYVLIKLEAPIAKLLKNALLVIKHPFEAKWFATAEARSLWLQQADGSASAPPQGTGYMQLPEKQLLQLQLDKSDAAKQLSVELSGLELKVMKELDSIARAVLKALLKAMPNVSEGQAFDSLLGVPPTDLGDVCDSLLHANYYAATAPDPAVAAAAVLQGHGARQVHLDRGVLTVITESSPGLLVQSPDGTMQPLPIEQSHVAVLVGHTLQEATQGWLKACSHAVSSAAGPRLSLAYKLHGKPDAILDPDLLLKFPTTSRKRTIREVEAELSTSIHVRKRARIAQQQAPAAAPTGTSTPNPQGNPTAAPARNKAQHHDGTDLQQPPASAKAAAPAVGGGLQQPPASAGTAAAAADAVQQKCSKNAQNLATRQLAVQPDAHEAARLTQPAQSQDSQSVVQRAAAVIPPSNGAGQPSQPATNSQQVDLLVLTDVLLRFPQREVCIKLLQWKGEKYVMMSELGEAVYGFSKPQRAYITLRQRCGEYVVKFKDRACLCQLAQRNIVKYGTNCLLLIKASDVAEKISQFLQWPAEARTALQRAVSMNSPHGAIQSGSQQGAPQQPAARVPEADGAAVHRAVPGVASPTGPQQASAGMVKITVALKDQSGHEVHFPVYKSTRFEKIFKAYWQKTRPLVPFEHLSFVFDGERVHRNQTPQDLKWEDGDFIDVMVDQVGD